LNGDFLTETIIKKKLIEVAMPLEVINKASTREKNIRKGHPSTLHLYWARRPLATCRAVIFAQLVDDPSSHPDKFPSQDDQQKERERLFKIIEELVTWENTNNEEVLQKAHKEILKSYDGELPIIYDPFSGGGSIPLEAQRLGLPSRGSDLNPVAVMIGKALIEIPSLFLNMKPIHPNGLDKLSYKNAEGLAEDVKYYGEWMRNRAFDRIGHLYPEIDLPSTYGGRKQKVIAWIWARTIPSPDPAFSECNVPLVSSFLLSLKKGKEAFVEPIIDKSSKTITYKIIYGGTSQQRETAKKGSKEGRGSYFTCLLSGSAISPEYIRKIANSTGLKSSLIAIVAEGKNGRAYLSPNNQHEDIAFSAEPVWFPEMEMNQKSKDLVSGRGYGFKSWHELFTKRQLLALTTFSDLIIDVRDKIEHDAIKAGMSVDQTPLSKGGVNAKAYSEALSVYLTNAISKLADYGSSISTWSVTRETIRNTFGRQAIPMTWDFAEVNAFSNSTGNWMNGVLWNVSAIEKFMPKSSGKILHHDAQTVKYEPNTIISTDPPYYDNIAYADLSDFFFLWMKPSLKSIYPNLFTTLSTPKSEELVALSYRHGNKNNADKFFLEGMTRAIKNMAENTSKVAPTTIYYAFKQSEIEKEGISSTGWATFLEAVIQAGYSIVGTWPMRTEMLNRMIATGTNALANSIVLVCRNRKEALGSITRAEFIRQLKIELPNALTNLKATNIAPADIPQSSIGPGIGIFSRYKAILENDDSHMSVKTALQLINRELGDEEGEYDSETSFAITWFEQNGFNVGDFGSAHNIANAKGISVNTLVHSGVAQSSGGKFSLLNRESLEDGWNPTTDKNLTIWECCQYLIKTMEDKGEFETAKLVKQMGSNRADSAKELAYTLYDVAANKRKDANEATAYNGLIAVWSELTAQAANITDEDLRGDAQMRMI
jgi:putative DNA methylase